MEFPIHIDTIIIRLPIMYFKGSQVEFLNYDGCFNLSNNEDPDEMQHHAALFDLILHIPVNMLGRVFLG